jgi:hypothetical protein
MKTKMSRDQWRAFNKVDPIVGLSPRQQEEKWDRIMSQVRDQTDVKPKRKVGVRQPRSDNQLKGKAIELFKSGKSVKDVSAELDITYANAYYYSRFK